MQIDGKNPELLAALNARLVKELGETFAANCALDLIGDAHLAELAQLREHNAALVEKTTRDMQLIDALREQIDELRQAPAGAVRATKKAEA